MVITPPTLTVNNVHWAKPTLSLSNSSVWERLINSSICLIFPTCVLHSSMICLDQNKQAENVFFLPVFPATLFLLSAGPRLQHGSPSLWNSVNRKSFRQWPYVTFCGWNDGSLSSRGVRWRVSAHFWDRSQGLGGRLLLRRPLLCPLQDVLEQQTTTWRTNTINWAHFFHLDVSDGGEVRCPCVFADGWGESESDTGNIPQNKARQWAVTGNSQCSCMMRREGSVLQNVLMHLCVSVGVCACTLEELV